MDSEQPIESPGSSMDMPDSPTSAYGPPSVQSSAYMPAQKREAAKVNTNIIVSILLSFLFHCRDYMKSIQTKFYAFTREEMISYTWRVKELEWKGKKKNVVAEKN